MVSELKRDKKKTEHRSVLCARLHVYPTLERSKNRKAGHLGPKNRLEKI